jgi:hypothetical protein
LGAGSTTAPPTAPSGSALAPSATAAAPSASATPRQFLSHAFTDVRDGKQFKLTDFPGRTVLVIGMAVW